MAVLSSDLDVGVSSSLNCSSECCSRNAKCDSGCCILNERLELVDELNSICRDTAVHLPVACSEDPADLLVVEAIDTGENLTLDVLERSAAACGDVGYLVSIAELLDSSCGVTAADDGDSICISDCLSESLGTYCELIELEYACRAVPDDRLSFLDSCRECLDCLRTDVEAFPTVRDLH